MLIRNRRAALILAMLALTRVLSGIANAGPVQKPNATPNHPGLAPAAPVLITPQNQAAYSHILPTGRLVAPVGLITGTPNFPTGIAVASNLVAVLSNGATAAQTITFYDLKTLVRVGQVSGVRPGVNKMPADAGAVVKGQNFFQGLIAAHGIFYAAGGASNDVLAISLANGTPTVIHRYTLTAQPFPHSQYPYVYQGMRSKKPRHFYPAALAAQGHYLYVAGLLANNVARINLTKGTTRYLNVGPYPNALALADHGHVLAVSLWGANAVTLIDTAHFSHLGRVQIGPTLTAQSIEAGLHPIALAARQSTPHLYVALANADAVVEINTATRQVMRRIDLRPYAGAAVGTEPDGLALTGTRLFVANAGNDDVATLDTKTGAVRGLTPTGWYPTALAATPHALLVLSGKGVGAGPNLHGQWVGTMIHGLLERIPRDRSLSTRNAETIAALTNNGFAPAQRARLAARNAALAKSLRGKIRTVVLILRENKTFDEEFGKYPGLGHWADPKLDLYGAAQLPNLYAMAHDGALFTDFDADGEVTAQGHQWTTAAADSDFVQRSWGQYYSNRGLQGNPGWTQPLLAAATNHDNDNPYSDVTDLSKLKRPATNPWISYPNGRFLFDDLARHHIAFENFGEFIARDRAGAVRPDIHAASELRYPEWDRMILDTTRAGIAVRWIKAHQNDLPHFIYVYLPDDHTAGRNPCYYTPDYFVANNDHATGEILASLSHTKAWAHMAVFVTEDDAQSGADHIDAHRTFLTAYGPWIKRGALITKPYSQVDVMRTIEAITRVPPMSQWDQNAKIISGIWSARPDLAPFITQPYRTAMAINPGQCALTRTLRRKAGAVGKLLTPDFAAAMAKHAMIRNGASNPDAQLYTPTTLLKVSGPEQMRQEWIASKGAASYRRVMAYLAHHAAARRAPLSAFQGQDN
jgi:YVTN family beta-propeller protein